MMGAPPRNVMNLHWIHALRARARRRGCDVILNGGLGNATFSFDGDGVLPGLLRGGRLSRLARELRVVRPRHASYLHAFVSRAAMPLLPDPIWRTQHYWRHGGGNELPVWCGLNPAWAREMGVRDRAKDFGFDPAFRQLADTRASRLAILGGSGESGDVSQAMEAISGVPKRDPTSYRPFVEFCFGIPDDQFLRDGETRWLARRLLKGKVPDLVLNEKRRGLQGADWHLRLGRDRRSLDDELAGLARDPAMAARFDLPKLRKALANWPAQTPVDDPHQCQVLCLALPRVLATARFIKHVEGQNA
jgi:asparagine synthase (glutamine-hydrolysing)